MAKYKVNPLTAKERAWCRKLEDLLSNCPSSRLALVTIGDSSLNVIDNDVVREYDLDIHDWHAESNGVVLYNLLGDVIVHGVSG